MNEEQQQTNNPGGEVQEAPQVEVNAVDVANAVKSHRCSCAARCLFKAMN